jgi:hypothetical protein
MVWLWMTPPPDAVTVNTYVPDGKDRLVLILSVMVVVPLPPMANIVPPVEN